MRLVKALSVLSIIGLSNNIAKADDGVTVDLSVLNSLDTGYYAEPEPMFPILPEQPVINTRKKTINKVTESTSKTKRIVVSDPQKTTNAKQQKQENIVKIITNPQKEVVVVDVEPTITAPKPEVAVTKPQVKVAKPEVAVTKPKIDNSESEVVINNQSEKNFDEQVKQPNTADIASLARKNTENNAVENKVTKDEVVEKTREENKAAALSDGNKDVDVALNDTNNLLVDTENDTAPQKQQDLSIIKFAEDEDILNDNHKEQIDELVSDFRNEKTNKVAIYAYNLDDGVDSFRRKRISLNRAIEVRSYLLRKGFKNFSIKVVNISNASDKVNTLEIKEI